MSIKKKVFSGVKWTSLSSGIMAVVQLLKVAVLTRYLDKADFGLMAIILFVIGFLNLFMDMGLSTAILHKKTISKKEYGSLYWTNVGLSVIIFLVLVLISPVIASFYDLPDLDFLIPLMGTGVIISSIGRQFKTISQKELDFKKIGIVESSSAILSLILSIVLAVNGYGVYSLIFGVLFQYLLINLYFFFDGVIKRGLLFRFSYTEVAPFLKIGVYQSGGQIVNYFNRDIDILIIGKVFGPEILGGYSLAKQLVFSPVQLINPILTKVASPVLAKFQDNLVRLKENYLHLVNLVATINVPVYLFMFAFAPLIVGILYGAQYSNVDFYVRVLSLYMIIRSIGNPVGALVVATGRTDLEFLWNLLVLLIVPVAIWIGSLFGIEGVVYSILLSRLVLFVPSWYILIWRTVGIPLKDYILAIVPRFKHNIKFFISNR